jgi:GAF domain-containing protein
MDHALLLDLAESLAEGDLHQVLRRLNARAEHRFTGVYRLDPPALRNVAIFDRSNPDLRVGADAPLRETYCSVVGASASPFSVADTRLDDRTADHPARESTVSYCGVPLLGESGEPLGTLCHFDVVPRPIPMDEISLMQAIAPRVAEVVRRTGVGG